MAPEKMPWDFISEEKFPSRETPPHFLLAEGQKKIWEKLIELEEMLKRLQK